jgi:hypothetical protein
MLDWLVEFVSGEKLLDWLEKPNGGTIIFSFAVGVGLHVLRRPLTAVAFPRSLAVGV